MNNKYYVVSTILFVVLLWAGNFIAIAYLVREIDAFTALTLRFITVALLLSPFLVKIPNKKDFIKYMSTWVLNPKEETSIMRHSIEEFNLMPNLAYDLKTLEEIAEYIYETNFNN